VIRLLLILMICSPLIAQTFSFGAKAGIGTNRSGFGGLNSESKPYLVGPVLEFKLPVGLSIEASALYSRLGESSFAPANGEVGVGPTFWRLRANSWEFPILAKRYLPEYRRGIRPFVSGGYAIRRVSFDEYSLTVFGPQRLDLTAPPDARNPTHGVAAAAGFQIPFGPLKIAPEVRYTRWITVPDGSWAAQQKNKVGLLIGFTF
jgi:hypothetical protein